MGQAAGVCTTPSEMPDSRNESASTTAPKKVARDLPTGSEVTEDNRFTNRITLRPGDVVEALVNPTFWETENQ